jgi:hypothetical protein
MNIAQGAKYASAKNPFLSRLIDSFKQSSNSNGNAISEAEDYESVILEHGGGKRKKIQREHDPTLGINNILHFS